MTPKQLRELPYYNSFFQVAHPPAIELARLLAGPREHAHQAPLRDRGGPSVGERLPRLARHPPGVPVGAGVRDRLQAHEAEGRIMTDDGQVLRPNYTDVDPYTVFFLLKQK